MEIQTVAAGNPLTVLRQDAGLTMQELAERVGVDWVTIYRAEAGHNIPTKVVARAIAEELKIDTEQLRSELMAWQVANAPRYVKRPRSKKDADASS